MHDYEKIARRVVYAITGLLSALWLGMLVAKFINAAHHLIPNNILIIAMVPLSAMSLFSGVMAATSSGTKMACPPPAAD